MTKLVTRQIQLIEQLYEFFERVDHSKILDSDTAEKIKKEYNHLIHNYGAEIHSVIRIEEIGWSLLIFQKCRLFSKNN
jgi:NTE family protein